MFRSYTWATVLTTGFALFSMFFGSGNLVFPLDVGRLSDGHVSAAAFGFTLTGVLVPTLGVLAILLFDGSYKDFFRAMGCRTEVWFPLIALSLMGPFGVLPRCLTVAQASFDAILPGVPPSAFVAFASLLIYILCLKENRILSLLGAVLTPALLLALSFILWKSLLGVPQNAAATESVQFAVQSGFLKGYQTMDLLAAFFFSAFVISLLKEQDKSVFVGAASIGMGLLAAVYVLMVALGSAYRESLAHVAPQGLLGAIALNTLGPWAGLAVCCAVTLACLTTAIALTTLFADYVHENLSNERLPRKFCLLLTLGISFAVSTLEFSGIAAFIGPILDVLYPALIVVTVHLIFVQAGYGKAQRWLLPTTASLSLLLQWGL